MNRTEIAKMVEKVQQGDKEAFNSLYFATVKTVYYVTYKTLGDAAAAQDVVQEVYLAVYQGLKQLQKPEAFFGWIKRITAYSCVDYMRKNPNTLFIETDENRHTTGEVPAENEEMPSLMAEQADVKSIVSVIIDTLPLEQRAVVVMHYFQELPVKEIAKIMETPVGTIKSKLNYARKKIKKGIERQENKGGVSLHLVSSGFLLPLLVQEAAGCSLSRAVAQTILCNVLEGSAVSTLAKMAITMGVTGTVTAGLGIAAKTAIGITAVALVIGISMQMSWFLDKEVAPVPTKPVAATASVSNPVRQPLNPTTDTSLSPGYEWVIEPSLNFDVVQPLAYSEDFPGAAPYFGVEKDGQASLAHFYDGSLLIDYYPLGEYDDVPFMCPFGHMHGFPDTHQLQKVIMITGVLN